MCHINLSSVNFVSSLFLPSSGGFITGCTFSLDFHRFLLLWENVFIVEETMRSLGKYLNYFRKS